MYDTIWYNTNILYYLIEYLIFKKYFYILIMAIINK